MIGNRSNRAQIDKAAGKARPHLAVLDDRVIVVRPFEFALHMEPELRV